MPWIITTGRRSGRFKPIDEDDDDYLLNGFACVGEVRSFTIYCPACGVRHKIPADAPRPRAFDRQRQVFRCTRCRFKAELRLTVDCRFASDDRRDGGERAVSS
jgi:transposase-like protein